ncbi:MAG: helix-turn-helix transcriptional regulator [Oscillospiraceae bacterium]
MHQRLFEITSLLVANGSTTAALLARRFEVSVRTIYRDIDTLSAAGVPVYSSRGRGGGIHLLPGYVLDKSLFSKQEQQQLVASLQSLSSLAAPGSEALTQKLEGLFGRQSNWLEVDFAPWGFGSEGNEIFALLREAIANCLPVEFIYTSSAGAETRRRAEPYKIIFKGQGWYLMGFCTQKQAFRYFKLTRLHGLQVIKTPFAPRPLPPPSFKTPFPEKQLSLVLWFSRKAAYRVYDEFPASHIAKTQTGDFEVRCSFPEGPWLTGYLLSFGSQMQVLAPPALRQALQKELRLLAALYQTP